MVSTFEVLALGRPGTAVARLLPFVEHFWQQSHAELICMLHGLKRRILVVSFRTLHTPVFKIHMWMKPLHADSGTQKWLKSENFLES